MAALVLVRFLVALPVGAIVGGYLIRTRSAGAGHRGRHGDVGGRLRADVAVGRRDRCTTRPSNIALVVCGFGFGLALAPVNAAILASTDPDVHGVSTAMVVVARMVGMLVGISALTTIGLRRYYAEAGRPRDRVPRSAASRRCARPTATSRRPPASPRSRPSSWARWSARSPPAVLALILFRGVATRSIDTAEALRSVG